MTPSSRNSGPFAVAPSVPSPHRRGLSRAALRSETFATYGTHRMTATRISGSDPKGGTDVPFIAARTRIRSRPPSPFSSSQFLTYPAIPSPATKPLLTLTCQRQANQTLRPQLCPTWATSSHCQVLRPSTLQGAAMLSYLDPAEVAYCCSNLAYHSAMYQHPCKPHSPSPTHQPHHPL